MKRVKGIKSKKGGAMLEYFFLILAVIAALIGMQFSIKRAIIAKWRDTADIFGAGRQYEPGVTVIRPANTAILPAIVYAPGFEPDGQAKAKEDNEEKQ